jgi:arginine/serine-rich splicing factor 12
LPPAQAEGTLIPKPHNVDPTRVDDIRRTVYVGNIDSITVLLPGRLSHFHLVAMVSFD